MLLFLNNIEFANKSMFWLFLLLPFMAAWLIFRHKKQYPELKFSSAHFFNPQKTGTKIVFFKVLPWFRLVAVALFIVALARPQSSTSSQNITSEGIDIIISMDISGSMLAEDLKPNRIEASKDVAIDFINERPNDRIGLVIFSGESFTQCPLTTDHAVLKNLFKDIRSGIIEDGTAIGLGLATAVNRLKESEAKSKVIILLTDGANNKGDITPLDASEIARTLGIRVYTIGVGTEGLAPYPMKDMFGRTVYQNMKVDIDEPTMKKIANVTGGQYFRANNNTKLKKIYQEIDQLEKTLFEVSEFRNKHEGFFWWAMWGFILLLLEIIFRNTLFKSIV